MHYQVSRNGQTYGPYTLEDLQRYVASGNVLPSDMAKSEEMSEWLPVSQILANAGASAASAPPLGSGFSTPPAYAEIGSGAGYQPPSASAIAASPYPDAPNLHWGLVLLFSILTCTIFIWIWNLVVAAWLKRVQPNATSLFFYLGAIVLLIIQVGMQAGSLHHVMSPGVHTGYNPITGIVGLLAWIVKLVARFSQRASLEEHFNGPEPVGLQLNPVMVFFFGGIYFQYKINEINAMKQAARYGAGRTF